MVKELEQKELFYTFLEEYAGFFDEMVQAQNDLLEALLSRRIDTVERAVARQQAMSMKLEQNEERREQLQQAAGFADWPFTKVIEAAGEENRQRLQHCFERITASVEQVRYIKDKSMELVNMNLEALDRVVPVENRTGAQGYNQQGKKNSGWEKGASIFETKI